LVPPASPLGDVVRACFDFDAAGQYARPDIFRLDVTPPAR
jgi:nitrilase